MCVWNSRIIWNVTEGKGACLGVLYLFQQGHRSADTLGGELLAGGGLFKAVPEMTKALG
jgi:hypothetical protein